jgi:peptidoglycan/xylan/chitin deacetylase (PgdA/CDA1 family)
MGNRVFLPATLRRLERRLRRLRNKFVSTNIILLYHRVSSVSHDPQLMCVSPEHFEQHMAVLREHAAPMSLENLTHSLRTKHVPSRRAVVTFDDGYADNLINAKPVLEKHNVPATVFIPAGNIGQNRGFYWDILESIFLYPGSLPEKLAVTIRGQSFVWELGGFAVYSDEQFMQHKVWHVEKRSDPTLRHTLYRFLCELLRSLDIAERDRLINELITWAGSKSSDRSMAPTMSENEIQKLIDGDLIQVGAHTVMHPLLVGIPEDSQRQEIQAGRNSLEFVVGHPVTSFAFPYGGRSQYSQESVRLVQQAGFSCACSNYPGVVWNNSSPFELPRHVVRDWDGDEFTHRLEEWFRG